MRNWSEPKKNKAHIELIPMIDVMMFLLVFFVLISLNVIPALGLKTQLPSASSAQQLKPQKKAIITLAPVISCSWMASRWCLMRWLIP